MQRAICKNFDKSSDECLECRSNHVENHQSCYTVDVDEVAKRITEKTTGTLKKDLNLLEGIFGPEAVRNYLACSAYLCRYNATGRTRSVSGAEMYEREIIERYTYKAE